MSDFDFIDKCSQSAWGMSTSDSRRDVAAILAAAGHADLLALAHQYRNDLRYPPTADSITRRLAAIDAGLTKAQRDALGHLSEKPWMFPIRWLVLVGYNLEHLGLSKRTFFTDTSHLTPLGLEVRAILTKDATND